jgi:phage protein D/phage baseplate assembly protein gpV
MPLNINITVNDIALSRTIAISSVTTDHAVNEVPSATIQLSASGADTIDAGIFAAGSSIIIMAGYDTAANILFKGIITGHAIQISGKYMCTVFCKHKAVAAAYTNRNRCFADVKDKDVYETIFAEHGLAAACEPTPVLYELLFQTDTSDWDFLVKRALANKQVIVPGNDLISIKSPDHNNAAFSFIYGGNITALDLRKYEGRDTSLFTARSWDTGGQAIQAETSGNETAGSVQHMLNTAVDTKPEALLSYATAAAWARQLATVQGTVQSPGMPGIVPGQFISLRGVSATLDGNLFVNGVQHSIENGQWQTILKIGLQIPAFGMGQGHIYNNIEGLQTGIVIQLENDPAGSNRIKILLPLLDEQQTGIWARVATLDAGNNSGSFFMPEIGHEVIVGFMNGDGADPVILGMVHSSAKPAPFTATDSNDIKGFITRNKIRLVFDDAKKQLVIGTPAGKTITIDETAGIMKMQDELGNTISMDNNGIHFTSAKDIVFKAQKDIRFDGMNIQGSAAGSMKMRSSVMELEAAGNTTIKGSIVQIN